MSFLPLLVRLFVDACTIGTGAGCIYVLGAAFLVHRFRRQTEPRNYPAVPVTIFKPLHGNEPDLYRRLVAFCNQSYAGPVQIVFGCHGLTDPAIGTVRRLKENYPDLAIELVVGAPRVGNNRKVCNLISMARSAKHNVFVISDSDIEVGESYLADVVSPLQRPSVGAVTCFYHGVAIGKVPAYFSELIINAHFLPQVLVAIRFGLGHPCFGATIALRRETLQRAGNFHSFANNLADDHAIGEAVRAAGYEVAIPSFSVGHACTEETFREFFGHLLRYARTIKSINPRGLCRSDYHKSASLSLDCDAWRRRRSPPCSGNGLPDCALQSDRAEVRLISPEDLVVGSYRSCTFCGCYRQLFRLQSHMA